MFGATVTSRIRSGERVPSTATGTNFGNVSLLNEAGANAFAEQTFTVTNTGAGVLTITGTDPVPAVAGRPGVAGVAGVDARPEEILPSGVIIPAVEAVEAVEAIPPILAVAAIPSIRVRFTDEHGRPSFSRSFYVTQQPDGEVAPGGETTFTIRFDPAGVGFENTWVSLEHNDATNNENPYLFRIAGNGVAPVLELNWPGEDTQGEDLLNGDRTATFGPVAAQAPAPDNAIDVTFTVANTGAGPLYLRGPGAVTLSGDDAADYTVVTQPATTVAAANMTTFVIRFDPTTGGPPKRRATVTLALINETTRSHVSFDLEGLTFPTVSIAAAEPTVFYPYIVSDTPGPPEHNVTYTVTRTGDTDGRSGCAGDPDAGASRIWSDCATVADGDDPGGAMRRARTLTFTWPELAVAQCPRWWRTER